MLVPIMVTLTLFSILFVCTCCRLCEGGIRAASSLSGPFRVAEFGISGSEP